MAKASGIQSSFVGGEFSDLAAGRVDIPRYPTGLATCQNYITLLQGPAIRRPGSRYVAPTKGAGSSVPVLIPFEFSTTQAYILEVGNRYIRMYKDNAAILETGQAITNVTQANPAVLTYGGADNYTNDDEVEITGVVGMTELNGRRFTVANVNTGANTFELAGLDSTAYAAYVSGGTVSRVYTLTTLLAAPYLTDDLFELQYVQSADILFIAHQNYPPQKITRTGHTSWSSQRIKFVDGPYLPINAETTTLALSGTTGAVTVTASSVVGINDDQGFLSTDVGRDFRWKDPAGNWTWLSITAVTDSTHVNANISGPAASAGTATVNWRLGLWSGTTGYPSSVAFFGDRLWFGGTPVAPQRIDGSNVGDYFNFAPTSANGTVGDANAPSFTLNSSTVNVIQWLRSDEKGLLAGTSGAEWVIRPSSQGEAITPTNISAKPSTKHGSAGVSPVQAGRATIFVQRAKRKVREMIYELDQEGFGAPDLTQIAEHITINGVKQLTYQQEPISVVWGARNDGTLIGCTYERTVETLSVGWHPHVLGGTSDANGAAPEVKAIAVSPSPDGSRDELWFVVKRYINGQTVHYIEYLNKIFQSGDAAEDALCMDCAATYDGAPDDTIGGLWHLEGETLSVHADGAILPDVTVTNGRVEITKPSSVVNFGYTYNSDLKTLRPDIGASDGTAMGKTKRINRLGLFLYRTGGLMFGRDFDNLNEMIFRLASDPTNEAVPLFTGIKSEPFDGDYDMNAQVCIRQNSPLPGAILGIYPILSTQDRG